MHLKAIGLLLALPLLLSGCDLVVFNPSGDIAQQQGDLIIYATVLMLIVIVPVTVLTIFFAIKYRDTKDNTSKYEPDWDHSVSLEVVVWSVPLAIIICLAGLTWVATHRLDPYQDLQRISAEKPIDPNVEPLEVYVVALDWKWLFIYPEQDIAIVNEAATIVDRPVEFKLTSAGVMNAFYVPEMAGMIYTMAGMETELNAVTNYPGVFKGFSANYSGNGFSHMHFNLHSVDEAGFDAWVNEAKASTEPFTEEAYGKLLNPSVAHEVEYFSGIEDGLWDKIVNLCAGNDELCNHDMHMVDALGGGGLEGLFNRELFRGICYADDPSAFFAMLRSDIDVSEGELLSAMTVVPSSDKH